MVPTIDTTATGKNIKRLRLERGLTVAQVAEYLGFASQQSVYHWENGTSLPSIDNLFILCDLYHLSAHDIIIVRKTHNAVTPKLNIVREQQADACCSVIFRDFSQSADRCAA